jgi:hypothetical protein
VKLLFLEKSKARGLDLIGVFPSLAGGKGQVVGDGICTVTGVAKFK